MRRSDQLLSGDRQQVPQDVPVYMRAKVQINPIGAEVLQKSKGRAVGAPFTAHSGRLAASARGAGGCGRQRKAAKSVRYFTGAKLPENHATPIAK